MWELWIHIILIHIPMNSLLLRMNSYMRCIWIHIPMNSYHSKLWIHGRHYEFIPTKNPDVLAQRNAARCSTILHDSLAVSTFCYPVPTREGQTPLTSSGTDSTSDLDNNFISTASNRRWELCLTRTDAAAASIADLNDDLISTAPTWRWETYYTHSHSLLQTWAASVGTMFAISGSMQ